MTFLKSFASNCGDAVEDACGTAMDGDPHIGWLGSSIHSGIAYGIPAFWEFDPWHGPAGCP